MGTDTDAITITRLDGCYDVACDGKSTGKVTFDEALGTIAVLMIEKCKFLPCLHWMKTPEEHAADKARMGQRLEKATGARHEA